MRIVAIKPLPTFPRALIINTIRCLRVSPLPVCRSEGQPGSRAAGRDLEIMLPLPGGGGGRINLCGVASLVYQEICIFRQKSTIMTLREITFQVFPVLKVLPRNSDLPLILCLLSPPPSAIHLRFACSAISPCLRQRNYKTSRDMIYGHIPRGTYHRFDKSSSSSCSTFTARIRQQFPPLNNCTCMQILSHRHHDDRRISLHHHRRVMFVSVNHKRDLLEDNVLALIK